MAVTDPDDRPHAPAHPVGDLLSQGADALRAAVTGDWEKTRGAIMSAVREATRPAWPIRAVMAGDGETPPAGKTHVSTRVVSTVLGQALSGQHRCALVDLHLDLDGDELARAGLDVAASYGVDLVLLADLVRDTAAAVLSDLLGPSAGAGAPAVIDVHVVEVIEGDPRLA